MTQKPATFGEVLRALREGRGISQKQLAHRIQMNARKIKDWESDVSFPVGNERLRLKKASGLDVERYFHLIPDLPDPKARTVLVQVETEIESSTEPTEDVAEDLADASSVTASPVTPAMLAAIDSTLPEHPEEDAPPPPPPPPPPPVPRPPSGEPKPKEIEMGKFGPTLAKARAEKAWSQKETAAKIGIHEFTLGQWERGAQTPMRRDDRAKLREVFPELSPYLDKMDKDDPKSAPPKTGMKICSKCGEEKSLADFSARSASSDGVAPHCKKCHYQLWGRPAKAGKKRGRPPAPARALAAKIIKAIPTKALPAAPAKASNLTELSERLQRAVQLRVDAQAHLLEAQAQARDADAAVEECMRLIQETLAATRAGGQ